MILSTKDVVKTLMKFIFHIIYTTPIYIPPNITNFQQKISIAQPFISSLIQPTKNHYILRSFIIYLDPLCSTGGNFHYLQNIARRLEPQILVAVTHPSRSHMKLSYPNSQITPAIIA